MVVIIFCARVRKKKIAVDDLTDVVQTDHLGMNLITISAFFE